MHYKQGAEVRTSDCSKVGEINKVIVDPSTNSVTHLVVKKGLLFKTDRVLPADFIEKTHEDHVTLKEGAPEIDDLPEFEEKQYVTAADMNETDYAPSLFWYYPRIGWWADGTEFVTPPFSIKTETNIPEGTVVILEGEKALSSDGAELGEVSRIYTEPEQNRITHILIQKGVINKEKKLIPIDWVKTVSEDQILLSVPEQIIRNLPEYTEPV